MKIKYLTGPKAGTIAHVPNSQEFQVLAAAGLIELQPYKNYQERLAAEMPPAAVATVGWGVKHCLAANSGPSVVVIKTTNDGQTIYDAPPADCPPAVVAKFRKEAAVYAQVEQDRAHARKTAEDIRTR